MAVATGRKRERSERTKRILQTAINRDRERFTGWRPGDPPPPKISAVWKRNNRTTVFPLTIDDRIKLERLRNSTGLGGSLAKALRDAIQSQYNRACGMERPVRLQVYERFASDRSANREVSAVLEPTERRMIETLAKRLGVSPTEAVRRAIRAEYHERAVAGRVD